MGLNCRRGITLVAAVMLIVFASIAVLGIVVFITQRLQDQGAQEASLKSIYLAQAGIQQSVYAYRFRDVSANGSFSLGRTDIDADNYFIVGATAADLLMVDTVASARSGTREITGWNIQNATDSQTITIESMTVSWGGVSGAKLQRVTLNGVRLWNGNSDSGETVNITDFTLDAVPSLYGGNILRFNKDISGMTSLEVSFHLSDGTTRSMVIYPASNNFSFTVRAMGRTSASAAYRSIKADYNARTARITEYAEIDEPVS